MSYTFKQVKTTDVDDFSKDNGIFFQTSNWCRFRRIFKPAAFLGFEDNTTTVLSCIIYKLPIYLTPFSIGYITRGFVCDYSNTSLVKDFVDYLKDYCKKHHIVYLIFDPLADYKINFVQPEEDKDIDKFFTSLGFIKNNGILLQPPTNYKLKIKKETNIEIEKNRIYDIFPVKLKNDIQISKDRGVVVERYKKNELDFAVKIFYDLLLETTSKKGFGHRDFNYYMNFARSLEDYVTIYLYKYNAEKDISYTEKVIIDVENQLKHINEEISDPITTDKKRERLEQKRKEAEKQLSATKKRLETAKQHTDNPYISASFFIKMGNKAYNFYGANSTALRDLKLTANYWDMIEDSLDGKVETFNMGGTLKLDTEDIKKDHMYKLYQYKCQYNGEFSEFPGEYFLIFNKKLFNLFNNKLNYFRRIIFKF